MSGSAIGVGMIGCGTVGSGVAKLLKEHADLYAARTGSPLRLTRVLVRDQSKSRSGDGINSDLLTDDPDSFFATQEMQIVVEVAGGLDPIGAYVRRALETGRHVVTANKSLLSAQGPALFDLARRHQVAIAFEASCAGGIPIVTALQYGLMANRVVALYGILNGTCNYILSQMTQYGETYQEALRGAQDQGFAEADPTLDVTGQDAAQKLAILASLAFGVVANGHKVRCEGIDQLQLADIRFGAELGYDVKLLAIAEHFPQQSPGCVSLRVHPCFVRIGSPLAEVHGAYNAVSVYGDAVGHSFYCGHGAGQMPTASAVVSDLLNLASGWYPYGFERMTLWREDQPQADPINPDDLTSRFYIRINAQDEPGVLAKVAQILGKGEISLSAVLQHESSDGRFVPVVITTHDARQGALDRALEEIAGLDVVQGRPVWIRIVDLPDQ